MLNIKMLKQSLEYKQLKTAYTNNMKTKKEKIISIVLIVVSLLLVAGLGTLFVNLGQEWFNGLVRPSQFVPNFVIPIMWTIIYILYAVLISLIVNKYNYNKNFIYLLIVNGIFNVLWCLVFFTFNLTFLGLVVIILLLILSYMLAFKIKKYNKLYYYLCLIYPIWVSIATMLNASLWILN